MALDEQVSGQLNDGEVTKQWEMLLRFFDSYEALRKPGNPSDKRAKIILDEIRQLDFQPQMRIGLMLEDFAYAALNAYTLLADSKAPKSELKEALDHYLLRREQMETWHQKIFLPRLAMYAASNSDLKYDGDLRDLTPERHLVKSLADSNLKKYNPN